MGRTAQKSKGLNSKFKPANFSKFTLLSPLSFQTNRMLTRLSNQNILSP